LYLIWIYLWQDFFLRMAEASGHAVGPEPLVAAFMWGIRHSVCRLLMISHCLHFLQNRFICVAFHAQSRTEQHLSMTS